MTPARDFEALKMIRDDSDNKDFQGLVQLLDKDLFDRYGNLQEFFDQFNGLDRIKGVVVAYINDDPVGCGAMKKYSNDCMEIKRMFVKKQYRGRGIAKQVLAELESWAAEQNFTTCILETGTEQPEAIALYQNVGYTITGNYGPYIGIDLSVCMQKKLIGPS